MTTEKLIGKEKTTYYSLLSREIRPIINWNEFLQRWEVAVTVEEMLGLLHAGFDVLCFDRADQKEGNFDYTDRLSFYFGIADGWMSSSLLEAKGDYWEGYRCKINGKDDGGRKRPCELRRILAEKAFSQLCQNFFHPKNRELRNPEDFNPHLSLIVEGKLFPVIVDFFRVEKTGNGEKTRIRNLCRKDETSRDEKQAISFLLDLANFLWAWREQEIKSHTLDKEKVESQNITIRSRVEEAKLWIIEVLNYLGELKILDKWALSEKCLALIEEIALRSELNPRDHPIDKERRVLSLEEAILARSSAACFLLLYKTRKKETSRLMALSDAQEKLELAREELKRLEKQ